MRNSPRNSKGRKGNKKRDLILETDNDKRELAVERVVNRKKGTARPWLRIDQDGDTQVIEADKYAIMRRVGVPARDLRILDPLLSYPSTILGRERAIVVNLEHIKCIVTAEEVLLLNWKSAPVQRLVEELRRRLPSHFNALGQQMAGDGGGGLSENEAYPSEPGWEQSRSPEGGWRGGVDTGVQRMTRVALGMQPLSPPPADRLYEEEELKAVGRGGPNALPFEFRALEVCLEAACTSLDAEATRLEKEAEPALDELTAVISTLNLESVRRIKSRLVAITGRVQKVREEIEQLLDDDEDMGEMYLTKKMQQELHHSISPTSSQGAFDVHTHQPLPGGITPFSGGPPSRQVAAAAEVVPIEAESPPMPLLRPLHGLGHSPPGNSPTPFSSSLPPLPRTRVGQMAGHHGYGAQGGTFASPPALQEELSDGGPDSPHGATSTYFTRGGARTSRSSSSSSGASSGKSLDVEELEMLLEAYFVQIEGTLNKLSSLREYVDDTEDYINIMLDDKQNSLLQMNVLLTAATLAVSCFVVVTGVFGMNIPLFLFTKGVPSNERAFYYVIAGCTLGTVLLFLLVIAYCKWKRLIA